MDSHNKNDGYHIIGTSDGHTITNFLVDSFNASISNFNNRVMESEQNFTSQYIANALSEIVDIRLWARKPTELEAYLLSYILDIKHDYYKALQHLLQGFISDHYLFLRRGIESSQYLLFLKEKLVDIKDVEKYKSLSTDKFKQQYDFKSWFWHKKKIFIVHYPHFMDAYNDASDLGVHTNAKRKGLVQSVTIDEELNAIRLTSDFHDCKTNLYSYDMMPVYILKLHEAYLDVLRFILKEKIFPVQISQETNDKMVKRFNDCKEALIKHYSILDPELKHFKAM